MSSLIAGVVICAASVPHRRWEASNSQPDEPDATASQQLVSYLSSHFQFVSVPVTSHYYYYWSLLYSAILCSWADSLHSHVILHEWIVFYSAFFWISTEVVYLQRWHGWCHKKLLPSWRVLRTPYNHAPCHFMQSHIRKVYACLAVTCHLRFWQNDWDLLRATVVGGGGGGGTDTEIRVSTESWPWRRIFSRRSSRDLNPRPFNHESGALTSELSPLHVFSLSALCCGGTHLITVDQSDVFSRS